MSSWMSEDITFCANFNCLDKTCKRNHKNIKLPIPHAFSCFEQCEKWDEDGAAWMKKKMEESYGKQN